MTKEEIQYEAQSIIQEWGSNDSAPYVEFVEKLASMELPESFSNLDEAANNYGVDIRLGYPRVMDETDRYIYNAFKAGAEWMAGQGVTVGGTFHHSCGYPSVIELNTYLRDYEGKEVIVQIRKKQQPGESLKEKEDD